MQPLMSSSLSNSGTAEIGADEPLDSLARVRYRLRKVVVTTQPVSDAMDKFTVDKVSDTPLYRQLALHMARAIREGRLKPGDRIPSERELADEARISRTTAAWLSTRWWSPAWSTANMAAARSSPSRDCAT
jgi:hypothetical protein